MAMPGVSLLYATMHGAARRAPPKHTEAHSLQLERSENPGQEELQNIG